MTRVVFTPESSKDLKDIVRYTRETWGSVQAVEYVSGLRKQSALLAQRLMLGKNVMIWQMVCFAFPMSAILLITPKSMMV